MPSRVELDQAELGDVAADRRLGGLEAALAEGGGQLLLGPDDPLVDEVPDGPLAELLHHLHRVTAQRDSDRTLTMTIAARTSR